LLQCDVCRYTIYFAGYLDVSECDCRTCTLAGPVQREDNRMRKVIILGLLVFISANVVGETVYFVVGEINPVRNDSYVLPLTDPNDIAHARALLEFGPEIGNPLIVAYIECCSCGSNRDYLSPQKPSWSWSVAEFVEFTDTPDEDLDGWPGFVDAGCFTGDPIPEEESVSGATR
jgi:hypothetical protein